METSNKKQKFITLFGTVKYIPLNKNAVRKGMRILYNNNVHRIEDFHSKVKGLCFLSNNNGKVVVVSDLKRITILYLGHHYKIESKDWKNFENYYNVQEQLQDGNIIPFYLNKEGKIAIIHKPSLDDKLKYLELQNVAN